MCGIAGIIGQKFNSNRSCFDKFVDSLSHRGPDSRGLWINNKKKIFFGHRRLSILDLSKDADQPLTDESNNYSIVFNGEIYNFIEIRNELIKNGFTFTTNSDTEVILKSYIYWGEDCQFKFNGMWAFVIYDSRKNQIFASRDRFGVKPFFYSLNKDSFLFASELKAFFHLDDFDTNINEVFISKALQNYTEVESIESTYVNNVKKLLPGHSLVFSLNNISKYTLKRWWNTLDHIDHEYKSFDEESFKFRDLFLDATKLRSRSDVPIASALSGGLDSSSVVSALSSIYKNESDKRAPLDWNKVFIADFPNTEQDETKFALEIANFHNMKAIIKSYNPNDSFDNIEKIIYHFEEIYDIPVALWGIYEEIRKNNISVSLDGHGGDELLFGYHHYSRIALSENIRKRNFLQAFKYLNINKNLYVGGLKTPIKRWLNRKKNVDEYNQSLWLLNIPNYPNESNFNKDLKKISHWDNASKKLYYDFHYCTLPTILRNFDRMSMAHGVEIRAPFMDYRVVTKLFSLPTAYKMDKGYSKYILRNSMKNLMPNSIRLRQNKLGFVYPLEDMLGNKKTISFITDLISSNFFKESSIWNGRIISEDINKALKNNSYDLIRTVWPYLQAGIMLNNYKKIN